MSFEYSKQTAAAIQNFDALPDSAYVRQPVVQALFSCSSATVWRWVQRGKLPQPKKFSGGVTSWNVGDLRQLLNTGVPHA